MASVVIIVAVVAWVLCLVASNRAWRGRPEVRTDREWRAGRR